MKKIIAIIMVFAMALCLPVCAFAAELEDTYQSTMISYDVAGEYTICIPMEIVVGDRISIYAEELNIPQDKAIAVKFDDLSETGSIMLTNQYDPNATIEVFMHHGTDGRVASCYDNVIGQFVMNETCEVEFFTSVGDTAGVKAGHYIGNVNFIISYIDRT